MVGEALDGLPSDIGRMMRNVAGILDHDNGPLGLLGLYRGVGPLDQPQPRTTPVCCPTRSPTIAEPCAPSAGPTSRLSSRYAGPWSTRSATTSASVTPDSTNSDGDAANRGPRRFRSLRCHRRKPWDMSARRSRRSKLDCSQGRSRPDRYPSWRASC